MRDDTWHRQTFKSDRVFLDPYTKTEGFFVSAGCLMLIVAGCLVIGAAAEKNFLYLKISSLVGILGFVSLIVYQKLEDTAEFDFVERKLLLKRGLSKKPKVRRTIPFDSIHSVVVSPKAGKSERNGPRNWSYGLAVVDKDGKMTKVTHENQSDHGLAQDAAERLAERVGCECQESEMKHYLRVRKSSPPEYHWSKPED